jgi:hypothetical protein
MRVSRRRVKKRASYGIGFSYDTSPIADASCNEVAAENSYSYVRPVNFSRGNPLDEVTLVKSGLGNIVAGVFTPVLAKHSKSFSLIDCVSVGVDRMQRNFEPMRKQVEAWQRSELTDVTAKVVIYEAFVEGKLEAPRHLARTVHDLYFEPKYEEFRSRTIWSLSNAFTSAFKELEPIPQFRATAKLGEFLETRFSQSF